MAAEEALEHVGDALRQAPRHEGGHEGSRAVTRAGHEGWSLDHVGFITRAFMRGHEGSRGGAAERRRSRGQACGTTEGQGKDTDTRSKLESLNSDSL